MTTSIRSSGTRSLLGVTVLGSTAYNPIDSVVASRDVGDTRIAKDRAVDDYGLLASAIQTKHQVTATYDGRRRVFCPHILGKGPRGNTQVLGLQFAGESESVLPPGGEWRCFDVERLSDVQLQSGIWFTKPHDQPQTCVQLVEVDVDHTRSGEG